MFQPSPAVGGPYTERGLRAINNCCASMKEPPSRRSSHSCPVVVHMLSPVVYVCCRPQWPPSVYIHLCRWPVIQFPAAAAAVLYLLRKTEVFTPKIGLGWVNWFTNGHSNPDNITKAVVQVQDQQMPPSHMPPNSELLLLYIPCKCGSVGYIGCRRPEQAGNVTLYTYIYTISHAAYYRDRNRQVMSPSIYIHISILSHTLFITGYSCSRYRVAH